MKPIQVKVELKENWAKQRYALFFTKDFNLAELDFPNEERKEARVYDMRTPDTYISLSSLPQGIIGAEVASKAILFDKGYYVTKFLYPAEMREIRKQAFKPAK